MAQTSSWNALNRAMLEKSRKTVEEMRTMIREYHAQDALLSQHEDNLRNQLKDAEFRREHLKSTLKEAELSLERMENTVHHLECSLSPMRSMPSEILLRIFHYVVLQGKEYLEEKFTTWDRIDSFPTPVILSSVCCHWRDVVEKNAKLWDFVLLRIPTLLMAEAEGGLKHSRHLRSVRHWIANGRQDRQSLFIEDYGFHLKPTIYSVLGPQLPVWKSISISIINDNPSSPWEIEKIRSKEVTVYRRRVMPSMTSMKPLLQYARNLTITGTPPEWGDTPWASLRSLKLTSFAGDEASDYLSFGAQDLRDIINAAVCLKDLELNFCIDRSAPAAQYSGDQIACSHRSLQSLSLHLHHLEEGGRAFGVHLDSPSLHHLNILSIGQAAFDDVLLQAETWQSITSLAFCAIKELDALTVTRFMRHLPNVNSIEMQGRNLDALFTLVNGFYAQVPPKYAALPLLKLNTVTMSDVDIRGETLITMLETRLAQRESGFRWISAVTEVHLYDAAYVTPEDWKRVNTLLEIGRIASLSEATQMVISQ
ncbi:hypothetical protein M408DRAFT_28121 [Serendipita vermifera MAFF 305830]|uniref:F-box domain-containing protein n=1 Tax=Serendipita vermifera MAFF 305830 TaxID=933852 RepID=A0A0C3AT70_SERVB|nr:hypothetical protein M408DRAFT_28121 [Serendipita vermifera MAFF 305830]